MLRVAVVADSPVVQAGLTSLIASEPDMLVVDASAAGPSREDGMAGSDATTGGDVSVMLWAPRPGAHRRMELSLGDDDDLDASSPAVPLVVLLASLEPPAVADAVRDGAQAVLSVDADRDTLMAAVRAVVAGLSVMPSDALVELVGRGERDTVASERAPGAAVLTPREREVLALLAEGLANKGISARLGITEHTVKTHVASVYEKLHARSRAEAVVAAARQGLLIL